MSELAPTGLKQPSLDVIYELAPIDGVCGFDLLPLDQVFLGEEYNRLALFEFSEASFFESRLGQFATKKAVSLSLSTNLGPKPSKANGQSSESYMPKLELYELDGKDILTVLAYLAKLKPDLKAPDLVIHSDEPLPWDCANSDPYGVRGMQIFERNHFSFKGPYAEQQVISSYSDKIFDLPAHLARQGEIVEQLYSRDAAQEIYMAYQVDEAAFEGLWAYAMGQSSALNAARSLRSDLED